MDPDATLKEIRAYAREARLGYDTHHNERELRWLFDDLDTWLSKGGALPYAWRRLANE